MGLKPDEFWDLSWVELDYLARHKNKQVYLEWDIARTLGVWMLSPHTKKKIKPRDLLKLDEPNRKVSTIEDFERAVKLYNETNGKSKTTG